MSEETKPKADLEQESGERTAEEELVEELLAEIGVYELLHTIFDTIKQRFPEKKKDFDEFIQTLELPGKEDFTQTVAEWLAANEMGELKEMIDQETADDST